jgi:hypothetical protein
MEYTISVSGKVVKPKNQTHVVGDFNTSSGDTLTFHFPIELNGKSLDTLTFQFCPRGNLLNKDGNMKKND